MKNKIQFRLVESLSGTFYWTVFLPTQINHVKTRKEAEKNLAETIDKLMNGKFEIEVHDVPNATIHDYVGGLMRLKQLTTKPEPKKAKKGKKK